jgi:hypothetical protein
MRHAPVALQQTMALVVTDGDLLEQPGEALFQSSGDVRLVRYRPRKSS